MKAVYRTFDGCEKTTHVDLVNGRPNPFQRFMVPLAIWRGDSPRYGTPNEALQVLERCYKLAGTELRITSPGGQPEEVAIYFEIV